jgi:hypothetical protein
MDYSPIAETAEDSGDDIISPYRQRPSTIALPVERAHGSDSSEDTLHLPSFKRKVMESVPLTGGGGHGRMGRRFTLNPLIFAKEERDARRQSLAQLKLSYYPRNAERKSSNRPLPILPSIVHAPFNPPIWSWSEKVRKHRCCCRESLD